MKVPAISIPEQFNIASYFIDRNLEAGRGKNVAVLEEGRRLNYEQLAEMVNRFGSAIGSLGIEQENRVLLAMPDSAELVAAFFGATKIGAVPVPVNPGSQPEELLYFLNDSGAPALVVQEDIWPQLFPLLSNASQLRQVLVLPAVPAQQRAIAMEIPKGLRYSVHSLNDCLAGASPNLDPVAISKDDIAFFSYTSGSTGGPKGAVHLQHDMLITTELFARNILQFTEKDIAFSASKLFFTYGLGNGSYFPFSVGAAAVYCPHRPKPDTVLDYIEKFRPTLFFSVPTLYAALLQFPDQKDWSSVRYAVSAGEALPADIYTRFKERFGISILDGIGSTEMLHIFISNRPGDIRPGSSGKLVPGYEAKIVDDAGKELPAGEIGNLLMKGDSAAAFYWRKHERTKQTMLGEWIVTGDKYHVDSEGYFTYCGRADDMLRCSGQWVSPVEVENVIVGHPAVLESAVVGEADSDGLTKPKAYVVVKQGVQPPHQDELRAFLKERLAGHKVPRWFEFVGDLPKTATGKIQRFKLRKG
ncbi:MAG: benzoate-CoA ligase family protein [Acidobacteria bacterium]|nr:benzoate-CoA ligase family protein [Acidobacteriota bacterium]